MTNEEYKYMENHDFNVLLSSCSFICFDLINFEEISEKKYTDKGQTKPLIRVVTNSTIELKS